MYELSIQPDYDLDTPEVAFARERGRLVRLCARLTGTFESAEDLAQETLLEAWRHLHTFHDWQDPRKFSAWLTAIARNVCLRWQRRQTLRAIAVSQALNLRGSCQS